MLDNKMNEEQWKWEFLHNEIAAGMTANPEDFDEFDASTIIEEAKNQNNGSADQ